MRNGEHNNLLIVADDLGLHGSINDGIVDLLKSNVVTGASLVPNGEAFEDAISKCSRIEGLNIGVHLTLVEEMPVSKSSEVSSLVAENGRLHRNHKVFFIKYILGLINKKEIGIEMRSQITRCVQAGIKPGFINGHQHLHLLPGIMDIVIGLAREYDIPYIRIVNESPFSSTSNLFRRVQLLFLNCLSKLAKDKIRKAGLECNDFFVGFINAGDLNREDIEQTKRLIQKHQGKKIELGCHPGFEDEELKKKYKNWGNYNWQKEADLLKNYKS
jgi:predicted glycoside hydrolase/deacetylase ChbG (UPF0249 family)